MKKFLLILPLFLLLALPARSDRGEPNHPQFVLGRVEVTNRPNWWLIWPRYYPDNFPWHHDFPDADNYLINLVKELTSIATGGDAAVQVVRLDSKDVFKYPFLYLSEPGWLQLTDKETANLGEYIRRGGFIMADDFRTGKYLGVPEELDVLRHYLKLAVPEREMVRLDLSHPIFHSFYDIDSLDMAPPYDNWPEDWKAQFWGLPDEHGNLSLIANYNNDIGDYWKYLDEGEKPLKLSSRSVRLGINYVVYAMSH